jgi:hypothetical protein
MDVDVCLPAHHPPPPPHHEEHPPIKYLVSKDAWFLSSQGKLEKRIGCLKHFFLCSNSTSSYTLCLDSCRRKIATLGF